MIKYKAENGKIELELSGQGIDITAETLMLVEAVYNAFKEKGGENCAETFKGAFMHTVEDCFKTKEEQEEKATRTAKKLLIELMKELLSDDDDDQHFQS